MDGAGSRLALWGVLVVAGVFVMALLALCNLADLVFGAKGNLAA